MRRKRPRGRSRSFGSLEVHCCLSTAPNPSYMCANRDRTRVYVVFEAFGDNDEGNLLSAYDFKASSGKLTLINSVETGGATACHVGISRDDKLLAVANYMGGSVSLFRINKDGSIGERLALQEHERLGVGPNADRQEGPHAHMALFDARGNHVLVPDLGLDKVITHSVSKGTLTEGSSLKLPGGSGPRHMVWHPKGVWAYVLNELLSTVMACSWDAKQGKLTALAEPLETVPGAAVGVGGQTFCAAIRISGDGRFVYVSNRGHCSLCVFQVCEDGTLTRVSCHLTTADAVAQVPAEERPAQWPPRDCPRDFALCGDSHEWLIAGNQDSDSLVVLARDSASGTLSPTGESVACPAPACILPLF